MTAAQADYLAIPTSEVSVERLFSAGRVLEINSLIAQV
jgi:hypothetical protein